MTLTPVEQISHTVETPCELAHTRRCFYRDLVTKPTSPPFELGDEKDLAAFADRLEIGGLVDRAVDRDGGFFDEVLAEAGGEAVPFPEDAPQVPGLHPGIPRPA